MKDTMFLSQLYLSLAMIIPRNILVHASSVAENTPVQETRRRGASAVPCVLYLAIWLIMSLYLRVPGLNSNAANRRMPVENKSAK